LFACFQFRIFTAPFHFVGFADFWLADQLNSLSCVLLDLEFLICYYATEVSWLGGDSKLVARIHMLYHNHILVLKNMDVGRLQFKHCCNWLWCL